MRLTGEKASTPPSSKGDFANRAREFANRARKWPGMPALPVISFAVAIIAAIAGAFGTDFLAPIQRIAFWLILMGIECVKWLAWLGWQVRKDEDYWRASVIGVPVLGLLIPFEIWLSYVLVGASPQFTFGPVIMAAMPLGLAILGVMAVIHPPQWIRRFSEKDPDLLDGAGISRDEVLAVSAEDHYCRVFLRDGEDRLIAARLSDLIEELRAVSGAQIHRSNWVSDAGVTRARRVGRGWEVILPCGTGLRVSATYRNEAKRRGWLSRGG